MVKVAVDEAKELVKSLRPAGVGIQAPVHLGVFRASTSSESSGSSLAGSVFVLRDGVVLLLLFSSRRFFFGPARCWREELDPSGARSYRSSRSFSRRP